MAIVGAQAYVGVWGRAPAGSRGRATRGQGCKAPPEAESSVAFEARAEEPNLTLLRIVFAKSVMFGGGLNSPLGGLSSPKPPLVFAPAQTPLVRFVVDSLYSLFYRKSALCNRKGAVQQIESLRHIDNKSNKVI